MKQLLLILFLLPLLGFGQQILTPSGYKDISLLKVGDKVVGKDAAINTVEDVMIWHSISMNPYEWTQSDSAFYSNNGYFTYYLINGKYKFYKYQFVFCNQKINNTITTNCVHAFELKIKNRIFDASGNKIIVTSVDTIHTVNLWYRLSVSGDHSYILDSVLVHNSSIWWVGGGSSSNWSATTTTNWSGSSGGTPYATTIPTSADSVIFDGGGANGNSASTNSATITIKAFTFTSGYTQALTLSAAVTVAGYFTDNSAHSYGSTTTTSRMTISTASKITSGGETFGYGVTFSGANTKTLSGSWVLTGALTVSGATVLNWTTNESLSCVGTAGGSAISGTAKLILIGGAWNQYSVISNNLDIAGNVTLGTNMNYTTGTLTYVSGAVINTSSLLTLTGSCTLNTNGMSWNNITISATATITISSLLTVNGQLTINSGVVPTFSGSSGFTASTFTCVSNQAVTITLQNSLTYTISSAFIANASRTGSILLFTSNDATVKAILTLQRGATCNVLANFTRIDASGGRPIRTFNGTVTSCNNIFSFNDLSPCSTIY